MPGDSWLSMNLSIIRDMLCSIWMEPILRIRSFMMACGFWSQSERSVRGADIGQELISVRI